MGSGKGSISNDVVYHSTGKHKKRCNAVLKFYGMDVKII